MALTKIDDRGLTTPIDLLDSEKIRFGTGNDLEVYTDGSNSYISHNGDGNLRIYSGSAESIRCTEDGSTHLFHNGTEMIYTHSTGIKLNDSKNIYLGTSSDLQIYHDGTHSYIKNSTGYILIESDQLQLRAYNGETMLNGAANGSVELRYDDVKKFETTSYGFTSSGYSSIGDGTWAYLTGDTNKSAWGNDQDLQIYHNGNSFITTSSGYLNIDVGNENLYLDANEIRLRGDDGGETLAKFIDDGAVELYYDGEKKVVTSSSGLEIYGTDGGAATLDLRADEGTNDTDQFRFHVDDGGPFYLKNKYSGSWENNIMCAGNGRVELYYDNVKQCETNSGGMNWADGKRAYFGDSSDLQIYHDGTNSIISNTAGMLRFFQPNSNNLTLYADGALSSYGNSDSYLLQIHNDGNTVDKSGIRIYCGTDDASGTNYALSIGDGNGTNQGYVTFSGGTVTYGTFTAYHPCIVPDSENPSDSSNAYPYGTLLETISIEYSQKNGANTERGIRYKVQKTQSANSRKVLGAYGSSMNGGPDGQTNEHQALVLGDGHILVNNAGGNIEVGDGICSSATAGIGQKATANPSMIIGIAQEAVTFTGSETKLVAVQYGLQQFIPWT